MSDPLAIVAPGNAVEVPVSPAESRRVLGLKSAAEAVCDGADEGNLIFYRDGTVMRRTPSGAWEKLPPDEAAQVNAALEASRRG